MTYGVWVVLFYLLGILYVIDWFKAQKRCKKDQMWLMFTPFWFFFPNSLEYDAKRLCRRVQVYFLLAAILFIVWVLGFVNS